MKKISNKEFLNRVKSLVGSDYSFLEDYKTSKDKILVRHNSETCNYHEYYVSPSKFFLGRRCPVCRKIARSEPRLSQKEFDKRVYNAVGTEYVFMESFKGVDKPINVKHNTCGFIYKVMPSNFIKKGTRCPRCYGNYHKTTSDFKNEVKNLVGSEYSVMSEYINSTTHIKMKHNICNKVYEVAPYSFIAGHRCPFCMEKVRIENSAKGKIKDNSVYAKQLEEITDGTIISIENYVGANTPIKHKCVENGHVFTVRPSDFLFHGASCPMCGGSKGERMIIKFLNDNSIAYKYPKMFDDLKDNKRLHYDFYLPDTNILIEYQGEQHYRPINLFGGEEKFRLQVSHDEMKRNFAKDNNFIELEMPYKDFTNQKQVNDYLKLILEA